MTEHIPADGIASHGDSTSQEMPDSTILDSGTLVLISISAWGGRKKVNTDTVVDEKFTTEKRQISARKALIDIKALDPFNKIRNKTASYIKDHSLPFHIEGVHFLPKDIVAEVDGVLRTYREEYNVLIEELSYSFDRLKQDAKVNLKDLYNESDYPKDIKSKFSFEWRFFGVNLSNKFGALSPELYEEEKMKYMQMVADFKENAVTTLRSTFASLVERVSVQMANTGARVSNSSFQKLHDFFETFSKLNITNDTELQASIEQCQSVMSGISADDVREMKRNGDNYLKSRLVSSIQGIEKQLQPMLNRPKRRVA